MDGFIPYSRAPLMIDVIACALLVIIPASLWGVQLAKRHRNFARHRRIQTTLFAILAVAVGLFEWELQVVDWRQLAESSPHYITTLPLALTVHLFFALTAAATWTLTIAFAWWRMPRPPRPAAHSSLHKLLGRTALGALMGAAVSGWIFYYLAFIA